MHLLWWHLEVWFWTLFCLKLPWWFCGWSRCCFRVPWTPGRRCLVCVCLCHMTKIRFEWQAQRLVGSCSVWLLACSFNVAQALVNSGICHVDLHLVWRRHHLSLAGAESLGPLLQVARQALHLLRQTWQDRHLVNFVGRRGCLSMA